MQMPNIEIPNLTDTQKSYDAMRNNLITVNSGLNNAQEDIRKHEDRIVKLEEVVITGNGEPSIREKVRSMNQFIDAMKRVGWIVGGAILAQTVAFGVAVAVAYFKYLPVLERIANQP